MTDIKLVPLTPDDRVKPFLLFSPQILKRIFASVLKTCFSQVVR